MFWLQFPFCIGSYFIIFYLSTHLASFYDNKHLIDIIRLSSLTILISPIFNIHYKIREKNIDFKLLTVIEVISYFFGYVFAVIGAINGLGAYSLVLHLLISTLVKMLLIIYNSDWHPSFKFNLSESKKMIWFSIKYKISTNVWLLERNIDYLILGRLFNASTIGFIFI